MLKRYEHPPLRDAYLLKDQMTAMKLDFRFNIRSLRDEFKYKDSKWINLDDRAEAAIFNKILRRFQVIDPRTDKSVPFKWTIEDRNNALKQLGHFYEVDPFKEYLDNLPDWDKKYRLNRLFKFGWF